MKAISEMVSFVLVLGIIMTVSGLLLTFGQPTLESAVTATDIGNAELIMHTIDSALKEVARDGANSSRIISFVAPKSFESIKEDNSIQFKTIASEFDYFSRTLKDNIIFIAGSDVSCSQKDDDGDGDTDIVVENSFIKGVFTYVNKTAPQQAISTSSVLIRLTEKSGSTTVVFANTSVVIGDDASTSNGTGYSELLKPGSNLPLCDVHVFVNSTVRYDIFYRLYAGADFFVAEVRNIR